MWGDMFVITSSKDTTSSGLNIVHLKKKKHCSSNVGSQLSHGEMDTSLSRICINDYDV